MSTADWNAVRLRVFDALLDHARHCPLCEQPGTRVPAGEVRVSSSCEPGIVLLTEWFLAKKYAETKWPPGSAAVARRNFP